MDNVKDDAYFVGRIADDLDFIIRHMNDISQEDFSGNEIRQDSMMFRLIQVSENARKLSEEYKEQHSIIPWTAITGLRNRIVHDYEGVRLEIVWDTIQNDFPELLRKLEKDMET